MECVRSTHYLHQSLHTRDDAAAECTQHGIAKASIQVQRAVQPVCLPGPIRPSTVLLTTTLQSTFLTNQKPYEISVNNQPMNAEVRVRARACHTRNTYLYLCRTKFPTTQYVRSPYQKHKELPVSPPHSNPILRKRHRNLKRNIPSNEFVVSRKPGTLERSTYKQEKQAYPSAMLLSNASCLQVGNFSGSMTRINDSNGTQIHRNTCSYWINKIIT